MLLVKSGETFLWVLEIAALIVMLCKTVVSQTLPFEQERFLFELSKPMPYPSRVPCIHRFWGIKVGTLGTDTLRLFRYQRDHGLSGPARSQLPNAVWCPVLENLNSCIADERACIYHYIPISIHVQ